MADEKATPTVVFSAGDKYDRQTGAWSRLLAPRIIDFMQIREGEAVLDVGCGTGVLALAVAEITQASKIVGIDLSKGFIEYARGKSSDPRLIFEQADAQNLPYADDTFDHSVAMLVLQFVPDKFKAIAEMKRVTKPSGAIGTAFWDIAGKMHHNRALWQAVTTVDPTAETPLSGNLSFGSPQEQSALMSEAGLEDVTVSEIVIQRRFSSLDEHWVPLITGEGVLRKYLGSLSPECQAAVKEQLRKNLLGDRQDGSFSIKSKAYATRGIVP